MPLYKKLFIDSDTRLFVWQIKESYASLISSIKLTDCCMKRLSVMRSDTHSRGFVSVRHLLREAGYEPSDLYYDCLGKPYLRDGCSISISHSYDYSGIIVSNRPVGVDIEKKREKVKRIAVKFASQQELESLLVKDDINALTALWCAKEAVYKLLSHKGLSFKNNMFARNITMDNVPSQIDLEVDYQKEKQFFKVVSIDWEKYSCGYIVSEIDSNDTKDKLS